MDCQWAELPLEEWFQRCMRDRALPEGILGQERVKFKARREKPRKKGARITVPALRDGFEEILNALDMGSCLQTRYTFGLTDPSAKSDRYTRSAARPHLGWYPTAEAPKSEPDENIDFDTVHILGGIGYDLHRAALADCRDADTVCEDSDSEHGQSFARLLALVAPVFRQQHRTFCYVISIHKNQARLVRVDRAGVLVSAAFDYVDSSLPFYRFFHNYKHATDEERGFDTTGKLATQADAQTFRALQNNPAFSQTVRDAFKVAATSSWPVYQLEFDADQFKESDSEAVKDSLHTRSDGSKVRRFLVGRATFSSSSVTGRATRIFPAYDLDTKAPALVKDVWRPDTPAVVPEIDRYKALKAAGVVFIPTLLGGGDVGGGHQRTISLEFDQAPDRHVVRIHSRLVLKEICRPLETFEDSMEFTMVMTHALTAHCLAYMKLGLLHRDVSANNILIYDEPGLTVGIGLLADWDLARTTEEIKQQQTPPTSRSGTWQFMSALLLRFPARKAYELSDDLESFIHIFNWISLKYFSHTFSGPHDVMEFQVHVMDIYDRSFGNLGGHKKLQMLRQGDPFVTLTGAISRSTFNTVLVELNQMLRDHYKTVNIADLRDSVQEEHENQSVAPLNPPPPRAAAFKLARDARAGLLRGGVRATPLAPAPPEKTPEPAVPTSPLLDHTVMFAKLDGAWDNWVGASSDKLSDQFANFVDMSPKACKSVLTAGTKRKQPDTGFHESQEGSTGRVTRSATRAVTLQNGSLHGQPIPEETHLD